VKSQHVAQDEHCTLARREPLKSGHECESDRFARLVPGLRLLRAVSQAFEQDVRVRLEPNRFAKTRGLRWPRRIFW
jgi:hypothetical protein